MKRVIELARVELIRRIRNRSALITAVVAPLALATVFGLLIGGSTTASFEIGVVDLDNGDASQALVASLVDSSVDDPAAATVTFIALDGDRDSAMISVDDEDVGAAIVIEPGYATAAGGGFEVLRNPDRTLSGQLAAAVAASIAARSDQVTLAVAATAALTGEAPSTMVIDAAMAAEPVLSLTDADSGEGVDSYAFYGASMAILFLFFTVGFAGRSLVAERRSGLLARVQSSPATPGEILAGKALAVAALATAGFVVVWAATSALFGARWGNPAGVALVIVATVAALTGVATFIAALARTEQQADSYTSAATFTFALLGGNFVGPDAPALLSKLAKLTPNGWALDAFTTLSADPVGPTRVLAPVLVLLGFALVFGALGSLRLRRGFAT
jgi:ABC-2 type transport system permease protein